MKLSIIILNYNAAAFLELCIYSVLRATKNIDVEIIVADNNSTDSSLQMLHFVFKDQIKVIAHEENYGFSKGNNLAVEQAKGELLCILNPDTIVGEEVFEECIAFARAQPIMGFLGVQLIDGTGKYLPESKRHIPTPKVARQKMLGNDRNYYYNEVGQNDRGKVDILVGAFMFCKREVYEDCGGFDERYFMYGEDIDLSYTAIQKGYQNYYLGDQKVIHFKGESTVKDRVYLERFYGAMGLFYEKYFKQSALEKKAIDLMIKGMVAVKSKQKQANEAKELNNLYLVTEDINLELPIKMKRVKHAEVWDCPLEDATILWDLKTLKIQEVIRFMIQTENLKHRFLSPKRDFYIGSDSSNGRGEIKYM
ncbi:glycosyl transferase family 2 [Nonlabens dokdonensis]|uniref:Glycosyl transferase family 2 n=1 Tax=Nonlabens dokdonensis TaxID=328515 RepID=A0A1Z8AW02_9FLAO|nr:glycosyltransferase family 2 protein [Nonlabens dokdonensis]OUS14512.1 glycosyl transferase family 2 [Nonlabens dokdonensis]